MKQRQLLSVFRAARLVGVTRSNLQKKIHDGELVTFEGMVALEDLLRVFPKTEVGYDAEYDRIQDIKAQAFSRRVQERLLPDANVLARRLAEVGRDLAMTRSELVRYQRIFDKLRLQLSEAMTASADNSLSKILDWLDTSLTETSSANQSAQELLAQDTVLRIMSSHIIIHPSKHEYWLDGNDTLLDAGVKSGLALNYGCTGGNCGLCKARVISGEVKKIHHHDYVLSEAEKNMNYILMCSCTAVSDVVLEALEATDENDIPLQEIITKVKNIDISHSDIMQLHLQTPRSQRLRFLAGQSVRLTLANGISDDFPIASCPCDDRNLIFHISRQRATPMVEHLFKNALKGKEITVIGPQGDFLFDEESSRAPIFIAYGVGFAPIKSLIEHAMALEVAASMNLYWAVPGETDLYAHNLCRSWTDALEEFLYHPVIANDPVKTILANHHDLEKYDIYLAGSENSVEQAGRQLLDAGLPNKQLFAVSL